MAETPPLDPVALWRDMLARWEKDFNALASRSMGSEEFTRSMNTLTSLSVGMQQSLGELIARYLTSLNLPSRADIISISDRMREIDERLVRISDALERLAGTPGAGTAAAAPRPPRTRRPPAKKEGEGTGEATGTRKGRGRKP